MYLVMYLVGVVNMANKEVREELPDGNSYMQPHEFLFLKMCVAPNLK